MYKCGFQSRIDQGDVSRYAKHIYPLTGTHQLYFFTSPDGRMRVALYPLGEGKTICHGEILDTSLEGDDGFAERALKNIQDRLPSQS